MRRSARRDSGSDGNPHPHADAGPARTAVLADPARAPELRHGAFGRRTACHPGAHAGVQRNEVPRDRSMTSRHATLLCPKLAYIAQLTEHQSSWLNYCKAPAEPLPRPQCQVELPHPFA